MKGKQRSKKPVLVGIVTSNKMQKTITVKVERVFRHPKFGKYIKSYTICKAHDEKEEAGVGDKVEVMQIRPLSKTKAWRLVKVLEKAEQEKVSDKKDATG